MNSNWQENIFSKAVNINPSRSLIKGKAAPYVGMSYVLPNRRKTSKITKKKYLGGGAKFKNGDTLLARITPCLEQGKTVFISELKEKQVGFGSTEFIVLAGKKGVTDDLYVYYLCRYYKVRELAINSMTGTSGRQRVQTDIFNHLKLKFPPFLEQQRIAGILGLLDDKIELNYEMNETMKVIVQAIFKRWFVDFEFPIEEGKPYKSSGGKMIDSEMGEIPREWHVRPVNDLNLIVTDFVANGSFASLRKNVKYKDKPDYAILIRLVDYTRNFGGEFVYVDEHAYNFLEKTKLFGGEIVISNVGANVGTIFRVPFLQKHMTLGPNAIVIKTKQYADFLYFWFASRQGQHSIESIVSGSAQPKFNKTDFRNLRIIVPSDEIIEKFNLLANRISKLILFNSRQNRILSKIRDVLLRKLLSGEIRVKVDIEKQFPEETKKLQAITREKTKLQKSIFEWVGDAK